MTLRGLQKVSCLDRFPFYIGCGLDRFSVYKGCGLDRFSVYLGFGLDRFSAYTGVGLDRFSVYTGFSFNSFTVLVIMSPPLPISFCHAAVRMLKFPPTSVILSK